MKFFLCELWPYLAGGLIGWLLAGWFARRLKYSQLIETIVEKEVVKVVDNPEHLGLISKLQGENSQLNVLRARINRFLEAKQDGTITEREVVKVVDNPEHLGLISKLQRENGQLNVLRSKINRFLEAKGNAVDKSDHKALISQLEEETSQVHTLKSQVSDLESQGASVTEVEKIVEIDSPKLLARIKELEGEVSNLKTSPDIDLTAARAAGIVIKNESDLTAIEGIGSKTNDLIQADGIKTFSLLANTAPSTLQKSLDKGGSGFKMSNPGTWPDQANLAANNRWSALKALQDVLVGGVYPEGSSSKKAKPAKDSSSKESKPSGSFIELDVAAAKAAGFKLKQNNGQDNFTLIEGIGPKINDLIHADGIHTFTDLSTSLVDDIQKILDKAGSSFKLAKPGTWPAQAEMAATNRWDTLKAWQDELDGGK